MIETLLQRVAAGDKEATAACVREYGGLVWSLARRLLGRQIDAEDAVQEVFIEIWKNASRYDPSIASETTFVSMIARRRFIDRCRRSSRRPEDQSVSIDALPIEAPDEHEQVELRDEAALATVALKQLRPEQRKVLQLAVYRGWAHQRIADRLGIPLGTVKTHVRRGLMKVREELTAIRSNLSEEGVK